MCEWIISQSDGKSNYSTGSKDRVMRKVVSLMHLSLNGYVEGPNAQMDWIKIEEPVFAFVDRFISFVIVPEQPNYGEQLDV